MGEGRDELGDVLPQVLLRQIPVAVGIVQTDVDPRLEQIVFPDYRVEK